MSEKVPESQFYMWRTLFALAHADEVVRDEEVRYMAEVLEDIPFSEDQRHILVKDIAEPQDIVAMFEKISDHRDRIDFFKLAHELVWIDGEYVLDEQKAMLKLETAHMKDIDISKLVGEIDLQFDDDTAPLKAANDGAKSVYHSFRDRFLRTLAKEKRN